MLPVCCMAYRCTLRQSVRRGSVHALPPTSCVKWGRGCQGISGRRCRIYWGVTAKARKPITPRSNPLPEREGGEGIDRNTDRLLAAVLCTEPGELSAQPGDFRFRSVSASPLGLGVGPLGLS